jgi:sugar phosphate isomerase/epimerase
MNPAIDRRSLLAGLTASAALVGGPSSLAAPRARFFQRIGKPIGLQLYTLGDEPGRDLDGVFTKLAAIGYRDIELPGLLGRSGADIRAAADRAGLGITCIHLGLGLGAAPGSLLLTSPNQQIADALGALGARQAVLPMMLMPPMTGGQPGESFQSILARGVAAGGADVWKRTAALLNERAAALKPLGIALGYHNHNIEFAPVGNTTGWDILARETDPSLVSFEVDLGWVAAAGLDPVEFLHRHSGRVRWVHVKDLKASTVPNFALSMVPAEIGAGRLDWSRILPAADKAGVRHFYVEQEPPFAIPRMEAVARSYAFLSGLRA